MARAIIRKPHVALWPKRLDTPGLNSTCCSQCKISKHEQMETRRTTKKIWLGSNLQFTLMRSFKISRFSLTLALWTLIFSLRCSFKVKVYHCAYKSFQRNFGFECYLLTLHVCWGFLVDFHVTKSCCTPHISVASFPNATCRSREWCHITMIELPMPQQCNVFIEAEILVASLRRLTTEVACLTTYWCGITLHIQYVMHNVK